MKNDMMAGLKEAAMRRKNKAAISEVSRMTHAAAGHDPADFHKDVFVNDERASIRNGKAVAHERAADEFSESDVSPVRGQSRMDSPDPDRNRMRFMVELPYLDRGAPKEGERVFGRRNKK